VKNAIAIIGAPLELGAGRRGVDMGPSAVRVAGLGRRLATLGYDVTDLGNISVAQPEAVDDAGPSDAKYLRQIAASCERVGELVAQALADGKMPIVLGGDHSIAVGTVAGVSRYFRDNDNRDNDNDSGGPIGLLWLDAHADMNTPQSSPSGNVHGMPLACCVGVGPDSLTGMFGFAPKVDPSNVALVGIRDVDLLERGTVRDTGVRAFTMRDIDERGMRSVMDEAIAIATKGTSGFHLSLDMDFVDPEYAPGVGTPIRGGATYREAHLAMEVICDSGRMVSMEVVEVNPVIDEVNRTADLAVELILSAMGKKIL
jgi:arginase